MARNPVTGLDRGIKGKRAGKLPAGLFARTSPNIVSAAGCSGISPRFCPYAHGNLISPLHSSQDRFRATAASGVEADGRSRTAEPE